MPLNLDFSQFKIGMMLKDLNLETDLRAKLNQRGFQTFLFNSHSLEANVVVLDVEALSEPLSDFVEKVLRVNAETKLIFICPFDHVPAVLEYREYNGYEMIVNNEANMADKLYWAIENASSELYFYYQNVEMAHQLKKNKSDFEDAMKVVDQVRLQEVVPRTPAASEISPMQERDIKHLLLIRELRRIEGFNETANYFLTQAPHQKRVYFSLNQQHKNFHCTYAAGFPLNQVKDLSYQSNESEVRNLIGLKFSILPEGIEKFILNLFESPHFKVFPVTFFNDLVGFFVFSVAEDPRVCENESYYTELVWPVVLIQLEAFWSRLRINNLEILDKTTEFFNAKFYMSKIKEEFQRAQRMKHPLSYVRFRFDDYDQLKAQRGDVELQGTLNLISQIINETGRPHDISCRLGENDFVLILPHCLRQFAAVRAERLRKSIEIHPKIKDHFKSNISFGVSEYPSLCSKSEDLEQSALKALNYIVTKGGNKVCIYRAPQDYTPPFEVQAET